MIVPRFSEAAYKRHNIAQRSGSVLVAGCCVQEVAELSCCVCCAQNEAYIKAAIYCKIQKDPGLILDRI